jgi:hypothetical protein
MNGARFVRDRLELAGWQVEIADAQKVKGMAPLACKTDRIDAWVLAELPAARETAFAKISARVESTALATEALGRSAGHPWVT